MSGPRLLLLHMTCRSDTASGPRAGPQGIVWRGKCVVAAQLFTVLACAGQNIRKLIKDGFVIRKPTKIHSRARARLAAEAKSKGRHTGYGESAAALIQQQVHCSTAVWHALACGVAGDRLPLADDRQTAGYPGGTAADKDPLDPAHAGPAPAAQEIPGRQEDRPPPVPRAVRQGTAFVSSLVLPQQLPAAQMLAHALWLVEV